MKTFWTHENRFNSTPTMTSMKIYNAEGVYVASAINSIQADKLVKICDSHDALVEAIKGLLWKLDRNDATVEVLRAALAQAEGGFK